MTVILEWLSQQVIWISLVCLIGAIAYGVTALIARRRRDRAQFTLEREVYHQRMSRSLLVAGLFLALAAVIFWVSLYWAPPEEATIERTPTPSSGLFTLTPVPENTPVLTNTQALTEVVVSAPEVGTATPVLTPTPVPEDVMLPDCPNPGAQLTYPVAGSDLSGVVEVEGTASVNAFSYYRFEVEFPGSDVPNFVSQYDEPVENGRLGTWDVSDPTVYPPGGPYRFQLAVVDIYGNTTTCTIPVNIVATESE
jgi:hypothetical protein